MTHSVRIPDDPAQQKIIDVEQLRVLLEQLLVAKSLFQFDASVAVKRMLEADLYGIPSHGCGRIPEYVQAIDVGDIDPRARVLMINETDVITSFDGGRAMGHIAATKGIEAAIAKAKSAGIGISTIGNSQTLGALSVYLRLAANAGLLAIGMSSTGGATVAAPGTHLGTVGNAAFGYAIPREHAVPIVFDSACGSESWGKLKLLKRFGIPIPEGIAFDESGTPTTDVDLARVIAPAGGSLGFGLSLLCSVLAGPLSDGQMAIKKKRSDSADDSQHFFLVLEIEHFADKTRFHQRLESALEEMKIQAKQNGITFAIPGERGETFYNDHAGTGIPLHTTIVEEIRQLASSLGIECNV